MEASIPREPAGNVQSVDRALDILRCLADEDSLGPTEIGTRLQLHKSTVHRLLKSLVARRFVLLDEVSGRYRLGPEILRLAHRLILRPDFATVAQPELVRLRDLVRETAVLDVRIGDERVCIAQAESYQEIRRSQRVGYPMELYAGAIAKVLLIDASDDELDELGGRISFTRLTKTTPTGVDDLRRQIHQLRRDGYALSLGERVSGATTVAVLVRDPDGVPASIALTGPTFRFDANRARASVPALQAAARRISVNLGPLAALSEAPGDAERPFKR